MTRRPITLLVTSAAIPLTGLALAACGGGGAATASPRPAQAQTQTKSAQNATVRVADSSLGRILVDSQGRTLYLFKADSGSKSACSGACAVAWPPLVGTGTPTAGTGVTASKLGTITRSGGSRQVTYNGHPLYLFIKDQKPGQITGQRVTAFGAAWFALSPAGQQISSSSSGRGGSVPAAPAPPVTKPKPPAHQGIPQNNGGDGDADNNGGPSDGDGNI